MLVGMFVMRLRSQIYVLEVWERFAFPKNMHPRLWDLDPSGFDFSNNAVTIHGTVVINGTAAVRISGEFEPGSEAVRAVVGAIAM